MVRNKPSTSSLNTASMQPPASTNISSDMSEKLPIRSLGAAGHNDRETLWNEYESLRNVRAEALNDLLAIHGPLRPRAHKLKTVRQNSIPSASNSQTFMDSCVTSRIKLTETYDLLQTVPTNTSKTDTSLANIHPWSDDDVNVAATDEKRTKSMMQSLRLHLEHLEQETQAKPPMQNKEANESRGMNEPSGMYDQFIREMDQLREQWNGNWSSTNDGARTSNKHEEYCEFKKNELRKALNGTASMDALENVVNIAKLENKLEEPERYAQPFVDFMTSNPTVWHAIHYWEKKLEKAGFAKVSSFPMLFPSLVSSSDKVPKARC